MNMNTKTQVSNSASPTDLPLKRKRGRPRKDESIVQVESVAPATPAPDIMKKNKQSADPTAIVGNEMVGQVVSGIIEGSFDAGYLLKVKVSDTNTNLRGIVFLPGRFTPISASNDVAPEAKMYRRTEMPIPVQIPPALVSVPLTLSDKLVPEVQNLAPVVQVPGVTSELQSMDSVLPENHPASGFIPSSNNLLPTSSTGSSMGSGVAPLQIPQLVPRSLPAPEKVAEENEILKEFESCVTKFSNADVEAIVQSKPMPPATPSIDDSPSSGMVNLELQIQQQAGGNDLKPSQADHNGVKVQNLDQKLLTEPVIMTSEKIGTKTWMEKPASPGKLAPLEYPVDIITRSQLNGKPENHVMNVMETESKSESISGLPVTLFERESIGPELCISSGATNITKVDSAPVTGLPVDLFERDPVASGPKVASDGSVLPRIVEPQFCSPSSIGANVDRNLKDAVPPAES